MSDSKIINYCIIIKKYPPPDKVLQRFLKKVSHNADVLLEVKFISYF